MRPSGKLDDWSTAALFFMALVAPTVFGLGRLDQAQSEAEGRTLAQVPEMSWNLSTLGAWPKVFEDYYNDQFPLRPWILPRYQWLRFEAFGVSPTDQVVVGHQGWLYLAKGVEQFAPLSANRLTRYAQTLNEKNAWLQARGIQYLFVAVPDKPDVYPEFMPVDLQLAKQVSRIDAFCASVAGLTSAPVLDLAEVLRQAKGDDELFYRNDPHWNALGAFLGYEAIMSSLADRLPDLRAMPLESFDVSLREIHGGGLARMMGLESLLTERTHELADDRIPGYTLDAEPKQPGGRERRKVHRTFATRRPGEGLTALVFRDSYTTQLVPFLSESFARVVYVWESPSVALLKEMVKQENPDVVIEERVSRFLADEATR
jgi:hypothetical protein